MRNNQIYSAKYSVQITVTCIAVRSHSLQPWTLGRIEYILQQ